jgi:hypothetical protein
LHRRKSKAVIGSIMRLTPLRGGGGSLPALVAGIPTAPLAHTIHSNQLEMKFEAAVRGRVTLISGLRSFTEASVAVHTLGHAASFATVCPVGVVFRVRVRIGSGE